MLVATVRFEVDDVDQFLDDARAGIEALTQSPGLVDLTLARNVDDTCLWSLVMSWESVAAYRRAIGSYAVKMHGTPLFHRALDEPSAYEPQLVWTGTDLEAGSTIIDPQGQRR